MWLVVDEISATRECPFCLAEVPAAATRCRHCTGDFSQPVSAPDLVGFWVGGIVLAIAGVGFAAGGEDAAWFGFILLGVGGVLLQIATIAWGVSIGVRNRDEQMHVKRHSNAKSAGD